MCLGGGQGNDFDGTGPAEVTLSFEILDAAPFAFGEVSTHTFQLLYLDSKPCRPMQESTKILTEYAVLLGILRFCGSGGRSALKMPRKDHALMSV
jgi:hypothetical protein